VFDRFARWCSVWTGQGWYFALYLVGSALVVAGGILLGPFMEWMLGWTTLLTVTTQLQAILLQNTQNFDTGDMKAELSELGRAVPGARDVIRE
jgi:low affinity Fe/Cu permease